MVDRAPLTSLFLDDVSTPKIPSSTASNPPFLSLVEGGRTSLTSGSYNGQQATPGGLTVIEIQVQLKAAADVGYKRGIETSKRRKQARN